MAEEFKALGNKDNDIGFNKIGLDSRPCESHGGNHLGPM